MTNESPEQQKGASGSGGRDRIPTGRGQSRQLAPFVSLVVLFVASFCVLNWKYGYVIGFQSETNDCFFLFGRSFLLEFCDHPAGVLRYAGRFLGQFYHCRWLGALIVSGCITCFGVLLHRVLAKLDGTASVSQMLLPCVLLLLLHTSALWLVQDTLGVCASCGVFLGYLSLRGKLARQAYALLATPIVYLVVGVYCWLFVAWVVVFEWFDGPRRWALGFKITYIVFSIAVPLIAWRWFYAIPLQSVLTWPITFEPPFRTGSLDQTSAAFTVDCILAVMFFGLLVAIPFWSRLFSGTPLATFWSAKGDRQSRIILVIAIPILAILVHWIRYDGQLATVVACRQLYKQQQWDALLEKAKENPYEDHRVQFMTNFALYEKGELLEKMFRYPQPWGTRGLFMNFSGLGVGGLEEDDTHNGMYNSDLLYEMGHANFALRHAYNSLSLYGRTYENLARMAECSMLNGNRAMALKYLNLLEKTLFHRNLARRYKALFVDPDAMQREFGDLRERLPTVDGFGHPTRLFIVLLESKPDNRMALEYLMAWLLLEKTPRSLESICADLGHLRTAGHTTLPRYCQEAVLLKMALTGVPVDPQGFRIDSAITTRMEKFQQDMQQQGNRIDLEAAQANYGDMYMFYYLFSTTRNSIPQDGAPGGRFHVTPREE